MEETNKRFEERTDRYRQNFKKYGYSEMSMDMPSDRRVIRYYELLKYFEFFQSPKTEPAKVAAKATVSSLTSVIVPITSITMGIRIPKVPQAVPVEKDSNAATTKMIAGRK